MLDCLEGERSCTQTDTFVHVLENESVLTFVVATASATVSNVVTDHRLKLERDVLDNVWCVRAVAQTHDETAALADAAPMLLETWHR